MRRSDFLRVCCFMVIFVSEVLAKVGFFLVGGGASGWWLVVGG